MEIRTKISAETAVSAESESQPFDYSSENRFNSAISSAQRDSSGVSRISGIFRKEGIHILYFLKYAGLSLLLSPEINDFYGAQIRCGTLLDPPALAGMARRNGIHPPVRIGAAALDQRFVRRFPPLVVESFRLGAPHLRTLECFYDLVDLAGHSRRPFRRDDRLVFPEHGRLHALPYGFEKGTEGIGLHAARFRLDRHGVLVHDRRLLLALAAAGQRILARSVGRAMVRIHGHLRRYALGASLEYPALRGLAPSARRKSLDLGRSGRTPSDSRFAGHFLELRST